MNIYQTPVNFKIPFPQANDIYKLIYFMNMHTTHLYDDMILNEQFEVVPRQIDYYKNAAKYLDLFDEEATLLAMHIFSMNYEDMLKHMVYIILSKDIFYMYFKNRDEDEVVSYLEKTYPYSTVTARRRFSTVLSWIKWCDVVINDYQLNI